MEPRLLLFFCFRAAGASGDATDDRLPEIENVELELAPISSVDLSDWQSVELDDQADETFYNFLLSVFCCTAFDKKVYLSKKNASVQVESTWSICIWHDYDASLFRYLHRFGHAFFLSITASLHLVLVDLHSPHSIFPNCVFDHNY